MEITEKSDTRDAPPESKAEKHSPERIQAIQGFDKPQAEAVKALQPQPAPTEHQDVLKNASLKASEHVSEHKDTQSARKVEHYKLRGRIGEELAQENIPDSANINDLTGKSNFANFDILSPHEMSSVKVKELTDEGQPRYADYNRHFRDIANPESKTNRRAAEDLMKLRQEDPEKWQALSQHLPAEVAQAQDAQQMANAMAEKASLRIPGDQVATVRENLKRRVLQDPAEYGLDPNATDLEYQALDLTRKRVKSINRDFSLDDMRQAAIEMQRRRPHRKE